MTCGLRRSNKVRLCTNLLLLLLLLSSQQLTPCSAFGFRVKCGVWYFIVEIIVENIRFCTPSKGVVLGSIFDRHFDEALRNQQSITTTTTICKNPVSVHYQGKFHIHRQLSRKRQQQFRTFHYVGGGYCRFCTRDNRDKRRLAQRSLFWFRRRRHRRRRRRRQPLRVPRRRAPPTRRAPRRRTPRRRTPPTRRARPPPPPRPPTPARRSAPRRPVARNRPAPLFGPATMSPGRDHPFKTELERRVKKFFWLHVIKPWLEREVTTFLNRIIVSLKSRGVYCGSTIPTVSVDIDVRFRRESANPQC